MAGGQSYRKMLEKYCKLIKPKRILEWGPGDSTILMKETCPWAEIISLENLKEWYDHWFPKIYGKVSHLELIENMNEYPNPKHIEGPFDLIFVDGRERVRCMIFSLKHLSPDGVLLLHDSERGRYKSGVDLYDKIEEEDGTICLRLKK